MRIFIWKAREDEGLGFFQRGHCIGTADAGKLLKKLAESVPRFQIIEKRLKRNTGPTENGFSAEDLRILNDNAFCAAPRCMPIYSHRDLVSHRPRMYFEPFLPSTDAARWTEKRMQGIILVWAPSPRMVPVTEEGE
jgi:hypothetical protein